MDHSSREQKHENRGLRRQIVPAPMPQLIVTTREGEERKLESPSGRSVMEAVREAGIDGLMALCGGSCTCATCHVYVDPAFASALPPMSGDEDALLDGSSHRQESSRLSCQIELSPSLDGLRVTIAPED
jgi:ferredoxin, 2Fe-2S